METRFREREVELNKAYDAKHADLDARVAALAEKEKDYLSRNAQLARRDEQRRLEKLLTDLKTEKTSADVNAKRKITLGSIVALFVVAAGLATLTGWHLFQPAVPFEWRFAIPFASSMFIVWATLTYFIQWNDRWAREHANAEFQARRYRIDALRAQWLAEWVSESAEGERQVALPPELVAAFSRNMFESHTGGEQFHALERLIDQAKRVEVSNGKVLVQTGAEK